MDQLDQLISELKQMGEEVKKVVCRSIDALVNRNYQEALEIINEDDLIDNQLIVLEEKITFLLAERNPKGKELRCCLSVFKLAKDLERIGDYATNIAEIVLELKNEEYIKPLIHIPQLAALAVNMLEVSLKAFVEENADLAEAVCRKDEKADNMYEGIYNELTQMLTDPGDLQRVRQAIRFHMIARFLERIADHATNIGEETILLYTGKRVKY
ncbi:MAG TPA: phosphate transport system regulatory protein PhoU [Firmicutes bacterium]|nr:phosphate transport system regulatory protein PhoU [Bacillota bacterium]